MSAVWLGRGAGFLAELVGSYLVGSVLTCPGCGIWGGNIVHMGYLKDESCHHQCLKAVCGVLGYPAGAAAELLDGTLKLRHCTTVFTKRLLPGFYLGSIMELVKEMLLHLTISWMVEVTLGNGSS